ncbi:hypothetical protein [Chitinophaga ginsengisoli]|uniref:Uncharacterized protein n=1 Tax=Chitinophaga ginsengisoli TaxID=363837 RepID=A0A2P8FIG0_9BACT|nr:hypothetical protein [Chitinophaga ginsengisoli]PSL21487.1 hypothetical protein CLV42_12341 [Chitinophaga ginsengisoli]
MKTTLFVMAAFLFSGAVSAQNATVKTTQSATIGTSSVNGKASTQTASQADIKPGNVKTAAAGTANTSTGINAKNGTAIASEGKTNISAASEHAGALKNGASSTTNATVKSTQHISTGVNSEIKQTAVGATNATVKSTQNVAATVNSDVKQTAVGTKATVKSVDAGVANHTKAVTPSSIKVAGAVHNNIKAPSIKPAAHIGANMKVGLR